MKHLAIILILVLFYLTSFGQFPKDEVTGKVVYVDVIELPEMDKQAIYEKAKLWIVSNLKSADNMVELSGSSSDQIVGTGNLVLDSVRMNPNVDAGHLAESTLNFKFIVFCKDNKVKCSVENFLMTSLFQSNYQTSSLEDLTPPFPRMNDKYREQWVAVTTPYLDRKIKALLADFSRSMKAVKKDDW